MNITDSSSTSTGVQSWRELYRAAISETDQQKLPSRIAEAERALVLRGRELSATSGNNRDEGQAMDDALHALRALRHCLELRTQESAP